MAKRDILTAVFRLKAEGAEEVRTQVDGIRDGLEESGNEASGLLAIVGGLVAKFFKLLAIITVILGLLKILVQEVQKWRGFQADLERSQRNFQRSSVSTASAIRDQVRAVKGLREALNPVEDIGAELSAEIRQIEADIAKLETENNLWEKLIGDPMRAFRPDQWNAIAREIIETRQEIFNKETELFQKGQLRDRAKHAEEKRQLNELTDLRIRAAQEAQRIGQGGGFGSVGQVGLAAARVSTRYGAS